MLATAKNRKDGKPDMRFLLVGTSVMEKKFETFVEVLSTSLGSKSKLPLQISFNGHYDDAVTVNHTSMDIDQSPTTPSENSALCDVAKAYGMSFDDSTFGNLNKDQRRFFAFIKVLYLCLARYSRDMEQWNEAGCISTKPERPTLLVMIVCQSIGEQVSMLPDRQCAGCMRECESSQWFGLSQ